MIFPNKGPESEYCTEHYYSRYIRDNNPSLFKKLSKAKAAKHKLVRLKYRMKTEPWFRLRHNLRKRIKEILKKEPGDMSRRIGMNGYQLRAYLEAQFTTGMTWENYGSFWHIDHIKPLSKFDLSNPDELAKANHYTNLQPLEATANIKKSNHYVPRNV